MIENRKKNKICRTQTSFEGMKIYSSPATWGKMLLVPLPRIPVHSYVTRICIFFYPLRVFTESYTKYHTVYLVHSQHINACLKTKIRHIFLLNVNVAAHHTNTAQTNCSASAANMHVFPHSNGNKQLQSNSNFNCSVLLLQTLSAYE